MRVDDPPLAHLAGPAKRVAIGEVYRGCAIPDLQGTYFFGDFCQFRIWSLRYEDGAVVDFTEHTGQLDPPDATISSIVAFGEDGFYFAHGHSVALDQIRVPLLWRPAEAGPGRVVDAPASLVDVAPTLVRAAGLPVPDAFRGQPLQDGSAERPLFAENRLRIAVIAGRA